jgi:hypothetical protein
MTNPLKTEHALDWGKTAQEIEDQFQAGMIERDRYRECLEELAQTYSGSHWVGAKVRKALGLDRSA